MYFLVHPLHPLYHASTRALILSAAPERSECVEAWSQAPSDSEADGYVRRDYVAVDRNAPVAVIGYGAIWPQREGQFRMDLIVAPAWRHQGVGSGLLQSLMAALQAQKARIVQARTPDYRPEVLAFLRRRGFMETNRMAHLRLSVANASTAALAAQTERLTAEGVTIVTLERELAQTPDCLERIQKLIRATRPERSNPYQVESDREFFSAEEAKRIWESYHPVRPDAFFLARTNGAYIGLSFLSPGDDANAVIQGDTAVHLDWRRRGIATLLKLNTIAYALQHGYAEIATTTANAGMLALNERLGFRREWAEVRLVKVLD